jgi:hypothetical protein
MTERTQIEAAPSFQHSQAVREVRIRLPRAVVPELKRVADANGMTMNALIASYTDLGLRSAGRPGVFELAAWFKAYIRRKGGLDSAAADAIDQEDDFT